LASCFAGYLIKARFDGDKIVPQLIHFSNHQYTGNMLVVANSGWIQKLAQKIILSISPKSEQAIIAFLDHETAKIDNLIEKQQQLIELLKEKRQAVISHAVTKGLNPDVPMKDSGVEWLGEVPEHWINTIRLMFVIKESDGLISLAN
jgi:type I restriction enzyme S subunit